METNEKKQQRKEEKNMKKRLVAFIAGCVALTLMAGVWAFYTSSSTLDNQLKTKPYGDTLIEKFTPQDDWKPGEKLDKVVTVKNTGENPIVVRIKLNEEWTREEESLIAFDSVEDGEVITTVKQANATDGVVASDQTVVEKTFATPDKWVKGDDGYWYYSEILPAGTETDQFLSAIKLLNDADVGYFTTTKYYTESNKVKDTEPEKSNIGTTPSTKWVKYTDEVPMPSSETATVYTKSVSVVDPVKKGYSDATYDLYVTSETCQATKEAVDATWTASVASANLGCYTDLEKNS